MRWLTGYFDSDALYYFMDAGLIAATSLVAFSLSEKNLISKLSLVLMLLLPISQMLNTAFFLEDYYRYTIYLPYFTGAAIGVDAIVFIKKKIDKLYKN